MTWEFDAHYVTSRRAASAMPASANVVVQASRVAPPAAAGRRCLAGESHEGVLGVDGCEAADGWDEGEEEVLGDEAPGEQADDRADLVANDRRRGRRRARPRARLPASVPSRSSVVWLPFSA